MEAQPVWLTIVSILSAIGLGLGGYALSALDKVRLDVVRLDAEHKATAAASTLATFTLSADVRGLRVDMDAMRREIMTALHHKGSSDHD